MPEPRIPNLFLIGAPKCGTTAMSHYLAGHPDIFMSEQAGVKEPRFFCPDKWNPNGRQVTSWKEYLELFRLAPDSVQYLGEATPRYLRSRRAIPDILDVCKKPRFVVMLRNPVELAASQHNQKAKEGKENLDFEQAWRLQNDRMQGRSLPSGIKSGSVLQYAEHSLLGAQMEHLFRYVDRKQVYWIFYGDFKAAPGKCYRRLLSFLELSDDGRMEFSKHNPSVSYRWRALESGLAKVRRFRKRFGLPGGLGVNAMIDRFNKVPGRTPLRLAFKRELQDYFHDDILLLQKLTGRDLSDWLRL